MITGGGSIAMATQQEMPHRLQFLRLSDVPDESWYVYEGLLSLAPNPVDCFRQNDYPIEFFLNVNKYTGEIEVKAFQYLEGHRE